MTDMRARQAYTQHVVRNVCCSGGRLCSTGNRALRAAIAVLCIGGLYTGLLAIVMVAAGWKP